MALPAVLIALSAFPASAAMISCSSATTLQALIADGQCTYQDKIFSNFAIYFNGGSTNGAVLAPTVPDAGSVTATFTSGTPDAYNVPGYVTLAFGFTANNSIAAYQTLELQIQYQVDIVPGGYSGATITGVSGTTTGAYATTDAAHSALQASKDSCAGLGYEYDGLSSAPTDYCTTPGHDYPVYNSTAFTSGSGLTNINSVGGSTAFAGVREVGAYDDVILKGGSGTTGGTPVVEVTQVSNTFYQTDNPTPEPGTMLLLGGAIIGLSAMAKRKKLV
jgi:hypothetical protein